MSLGRREIEAADRRLDAAQTRASSASKHVVAARSMEQTARQMMDNARKNRQTAQSLLDGSKKEVKAAEKALKAAKVRWSAEAEAMGARVYSRVDSSASGLQDDDDDDDDDNEAGQIRSGAMSGKKRERDEDAGRPTTLQSHWDSEFELLKIFNEKEGHCNVPIRNVALGSWVAYQRSSYKDFINSGRKSTKMTPERISRLESIGFKWKVKADAQTAWAAHYNQLVLFRKQSGHCNVPSGFADTKLANWVNNQRKSNKSGKLSEERIQKLDDLGFRWVMKMGEVKAKGEGGNANAHDESKDSTTGHVATETVQDDITNATKAAPAADDDAKQEEGCDGMEGIDYVLANLAARPSLAKKGGRKAATKINDRRLSTKQIIEVIEEECRKPQAKGGINEGSEENAKSNEEENDDDNDGNQSDKLSKNEAGINENKKQAETSEGDYETADDEPPPNDDAETNEEHEENNKSNKEEDDDDGDGNQSDIPSSVILV